MVSGFSSATRASWTYWWVAAHRSFDRRAALPGRDGYIWLPGRDGYIWLPGLVGCVDAACVAADARHAGVQTGLSLFKRANAVNGPIRYPYEEFRACVHACDSTHIKAMASLILDRARFNPRPASRPGGDHETTSHAAAIDNPSDLPALWGPGRRLHHFDDGRIRTVERGSEFLTRSCPFSIERTRHRAMRK
jgi:hypothetical protein